MRWRRMCRVTARGQKKTENRNYSCSEKRLVFRIEPKVLTPPLALPTSTVARAQAASDASPPRPPCIEAEPQRTDGRTHDIRHCVPPPALPVDMTADDPAASEFAFPDRPADLEAADCVLPVKCGPDVVDLVGLSRDEAEECAERAWVSVACVVRAVQCARVRPPPTPCSGPSPHASRLPPPTPRNTQVSCTMSAIRTPWPSWNRPCLMPPTPWSSTSFFFAFAPALARAVRAPACASFFSLTHTKHARPNQQGFHQAAGPVQAPPA